MAKTHNSNWLDDLNFQVGFLNDNSFSKYSDSLPLIDTYSDILLKCWIMVIRHYASFSILNLVTVFDGRHAVNST